MFENMVSFYVSIVGSVPFRQGFFFFFFFKKPAGDPQSTFEVDPRK